MNTKAWNQFTFHELDGKAGGGGEEDDKGTVVDVACIESGTAASVDVVVGSGLAFVGSRREANDGGGNTSVSSALGPVFLNDVFIYGNITVFDDRYVL
jgi:hypothetical protein